MRQTRRLGLAVLAALVIAAFANAATASASHFVAEEYPAGLTDTSESVSFLEYRGTQFECNVPPVSAELSADSAEVNLVPGGSGYCRNNYFGDGPLATNGCTFPFHSGEQVIDEEEPGWPATYKGTWDISCPEGKGLVLHAGSTCEITLYPDSGNGATLANTGADSQQSLTLGGRSNALEFSQNASCLGGASEGTGPTWTPYWHVSAARTSPEGESEPLEFRVAETDVSIIGTAPEQPKLTATAFPAYVVLGPTAYSLGIPGTAFECGEARFWGSLPFSTYIGSFESDFGECSYGTNPARVVLNSCKLRFRIVNAGPPYEESLGVICSKAGDGIEFKAYENWKLENVVCTVKLAEQGQHKGVAATNVGSPMGVRWSTNVTEFAWTKSGSACGSGSGSNGTLAGGGTWWG